MIPQHDDPHAPLGGEREESAWVLRGELGDEPLGMPVGWSPFPTADEIATIDAVRILDRAQDDGFAGPVVTEVATPKIAVNQRG